MANLRTNNLSGEQGQNAYRGSVFFGGNDTGSALRAVESDSNLTFGTGDFTIEFWVLRNNTDQAVYLDWRNAGGAQGHRVTLYSTSSSSNKLYFYSNGTNHINTTDPLNTNSWNHVALTRASSSTKLFVNGIQVGSTYSDSNDYVGPQSSDGIYIGRFAGGSYDTKGYISNLRIVKGTALYTADFTPPTEELTIVDGTVLLCCQDSDDATKDAVGTTITTEGNLNNTEKTKLQPKVIPPYGVDAGNTFGGTIQQSSQGYMYFPTGRTEERGRGRGVYGGGASSPSTNPANIAYIDVQSQGNTTKFGDLTTSNRVWIHGFGSSTRAIWSGGGNTGGSNTANTIDFVTIATTSNATDFGDATVAALARASLSNDTRGLSACGFISPANINTIDFVNVANLGNATDFGDATVARRGVARMGSSTRGIFAGGMTPSASDVMDFVTIATTGNATDFGNLVVAGRHDSGGCSSGTRGVIAGGNTSPGPDVNTIQFVTIASAGNASDFGDLQQTMEACGSLDNSIRGVFSGSYTPSLNTMNFITIATLGNALDFGDNAESNYGSGGTSDSHGGLS